MRTNLWLVLLLFVGLLGCTTGDDDDSSVADDDDATPIGEPPVLVQVDVCERPIAELDCGQQNVLSFGAEFRLTMSDPDGDLALPRYCIATGEEPFSCQAYEGTVTDGGRLDIQFGCRRWGRESSVAWEAYIEDQEGNESERVTGAWEVPVQPGDADCD
jgi:hypothetical protein